MQYFHIASIQAQAEMPIYFALSPHVESNHRPHGIFRVEWKYIHLQQFKSNSSQLFGISAFEIWHRFRRVTHRIRSHLCIPSTSQTVYQFQQRIQIIIILPFPSNPSIDAPPKPLLINSQRLLISGTFALRRKCASARIFAILLRSCRRIAIYSMLASSASMFCT